MTTTPPSPNPEPVGTPDDSDASNNMPAWMTRNEAVKHLATVGIVVTKYALTKMCENAEVLHRRVPGPYGEQIEIDINDLADKMSAPKPLAKIRHLNAGSEPVSEAPVPTTDLVLHQTVDRLLDQVAVLHEAGRRVGVAETVATHKDEQLREAKQKIESLESQLATALAMAPPPTDLEDVVVVPIPDQHDEPKNQASLLLTGAVVERPWWRFW